MAAKKSKRKLIPTKKKRLRREKIKMTMVKIVIKITILSQRSPKALQAAARKTRLIKQKQRKNRKRKAQQKNSNNQRRPIKNLAKRKKKVDFSQKTAKIRSFWRSNRLRSSITT